MSAVLPDFDPRAHIDRQWLRLYRDFLPQAEGWWAKQRGTKSKYGVEQTTARSYPTGEQGKNGPTGIFNEWAEPQASQLLFDETAWAQLATRAGFEVTHQRLADSLVEHWKARVAPVAKRARTAALSAGERRRKTVVDLAVGQKYKLIDLFVRWLWIEQSDPGVRAAQTFVHGHVPLDRKSLHVLSATFSGILVAPKFSMGNIITEAQYRYCQALARIVCQEAGGSPLLFDVFCWHHESAKKLYGPAPGYKAKSIR